MGHSEMLLAVAGLDADKIEERTQQLSSGDWSVFPAAESLAFSFAYRMTKTPHLIQRSDIQALIDTFGELRAMDIVWYVSWCNYMTRVADAFQLPLERDNVFALQDDQLPTENPQSAAGREK